MNWVSSFRLKFEWVKRQLTFTPLSHQPAVSALWVRVASSCRTGPLDSACPAWTMCLVLRTPHGRSSWGFFHTPNAVGVQLLLWSLPVSYQRAGLEGRHPLREQQSKMEVLIPIWPLRLFSIWCSARRTRGYCELSTSMSLKSEKNTVLPLLSKNKQSSFQSTYYFIAQRVYMVTFRG